MDFKPFKIPSMILKIFGLFQDDTSPQWYKIYGRLFHLCTLEHASFCVAVYAVQAILSANYMEFIETLSILLTCILTIIKSLIFMKSVKNVKKLMLNLKELMKFSAFDQKSRPHVKSYEVAITRISNLNFAFHFVICTLSAVMPLMSDRTKLPFKSWIYFDYESSGYLFMMAIFISYGMSIFTVLINGSLDVFPVIFMCYLMAILKELSERFRKVKCDSGKFTKIPKINKWNEEIITKEIDLKTCVELHVKIKDFCVEISNNYALHFMVQSLFSTLILCSSTFHLTKVW